MSSFSDWYHEYFLKMAKKYLDFIVHFEEPTDTWSTESKDFLKDWLLVDNVKPEDAGAGTNIVMILLLICRQQVSKIAHNGDMLSVYIDGCKLLTTEINMDWTVELNLCKDNSPLEKLFNNLLLCIRKSSRIQRTSREVFVEIDGNALFEACPEFKDGLRAVVMFDIFVRAEELEFIVINDPGTYNWTVMDLSARFEDFLDELANINNRGF